MGTQTVLAASLEEGKDSAESAKPLQTRHSKPLFHTPTLRTSAPSMLRNSVAHQNTLGKRKHMPFEKAVVLCQQYKECNEFDRERIQALAE